MAEGRKSKGKIDKNKTSAKPLPNPMAETIRMIQCVESYVGATATPARQAESLDAIASMLKNDAITMEQLVVGMEKYLTSTDHVMRGRAILLLAESLARLDLKPLSDVAIHTLVNFFSDRLEDWKAVRGALVGCLALLRRKGHTGAVSKSDAMTIAQSFLQNLPVQSLGKHDRELCFQLLECLLVHHPEASFEKGDDLVYGICEAADGEKDPKCLLMVFHIIEVLGQIFSDSSALKTYAGGLFDILGCYFPIHFTHPKSENIEVKRDDLSRQLMLAMSSTPFFEPYAVPLFLEKLSSALLSAKVDSLKYLSECVLKYGGGRMKKHVESIWSSIKDTIFNTRLDPTVSLASELFNGDGSQSLENEVLREALLLLQISVMQNDELFSSLLVNDEDISMIIDSNANNSGQISNSSESVQKLHAVGCILYISAKASSVACSRLLKTNFLRLINATCISDRTSSLFKMNRDVSRSQTLNIGALYFCVELLAACRDQVNNSVNLASKSAVAFDTWSSILKSYSARLIEGFSDALLSNPDTSIQDQDATVYLVKGLGLLATLPEDLSSVSKSSFDDILKTFMTIFTTKYNYTYLWSQATKELVLVGSYVSRFLDSERMLSFLSFVIDKMVILTSLDEGSIPLHTKLETICDVSITHLNYLLRVFRGLEDVVSANFSDAKINGNLKSAEIINQVMEIYATKVLPRLGEAGGFDDVLYQFAINMWNHVERSAYESTIVDSAKKEILSSIMMAMKVTVGYCTVESQRKFLDKAYTVLSSSDPSLSVAFKPNNISSQARAMLQTDDIHDKQFMNDWLMSIFASIIMALHPQTSVPSERVVMRLFVTSVLEGHVPSAQALGSMFNKLHMKTEEELLLVDCSVKELVSSLCNGHASNGFAWSCSGKNDSSEEGLPNLSFKAEDASIVSVYAIKGLAWVAKGLLMRGHDRAYDIVKLLLSLLVNCEKLEAVPVKTGLRDDQNLLISVMESVADAFDTMMSDSNDCLNTRFHAVIRPLYKQRLLSTIMPVFLAAIRECSSPFSSNMLYRALAHVLSNAPLGAVLNDSRKLIPVLVECLSLLSNDALNKEIIRRLLVVLSAILTDESVAGQETVKENATIIIKCLIGLASYPHMMFVRETSIQCLTAISRLPHTRVYPMRNDVIRVILKAVDDPKRAVRLQAVRCREAWESGSLQL